MTLQWCFFWAQISAPDGQHHKFEGLLHLKVFKKPQNPRIWLIIGSKSSAPDNFVDRVDPVDPQKKHHCDSPLNTITGMRIDARPWGLRGSIYSNKIGQENPRVFFLGGSDFRVLKVWTVLEQFIALQKDFDAFEYVSEAFQFNYRWF